MNSRNWISVWHWRHTIGMTLVTAFIVLPFLLGRGLPFQFQVIALVIGVGLLGLPHGALDHLLARPMLAYFFGRGWPVAFFLGYSFLSTLVVVGWLVAPLGSLLFFLLISSLHFGMEDVEGELAPAGGYWLEVLARGTMPIIITAFFFQSQVVQLFSLLMPEVPVATLGELIRTITPVLVAELSLVLAGLVSYHFYQAIKGRSKHHAMVGVEIIVLVLLFTLAPPLVSFLVYFCGWHSARYTIQLAALMDPANPRQGFLTFLRQAMPLTVITLAAGLLLWWALGPTQAIDAAAIRIVFVGLSALTFPHMVVRAAAERFRPGSTVARPVKKMPGAS